MRVRHGHLPHLARHLNRLAEGCALLDMPAPDRAWLAAGAQALLARTPGHEGSLRLTVTRGPAARGIVPPAHPDITVLMTLAPAGAPLPPARLHVCRTVRRDEASVLSRVKSLNALPSVLARQDAARAGADDALLLNCAGRVAESSVACVVAVIDGQGVTPPVAEGALPGIARALALEAGLLVERPLALPDIAGRSLFLINALSVRAVASVDGHTCPADAAFATALRTATG